MHSLMITILSVALLYPSVRGTYFRNFPSGHENKYYGFEHTSEENQNDTLSRFNDSSETSSNILQYPVDEQRLESSSDALASESTRTSEENSTFTLSTEPSTEKSTLSTRVEITLTEIFSNESNSTSSLSNQSNSQSPSTRQTKSGITSLGTSTKEGIILSSTEDEDEDEGVVRGKPASTESTNTTTSKAESMYQKVWTLINDTYTLSILVPVAAGVVFASTILVTIATCKCLRRQCRRRRLRSKALPDSVKSLRPSDRARLLAESSDEEF